MSRHATAAKRTDTVLIIEHDAKFAAALVEAFKSAGLSAYRAADGETALAEAVWAWPRLIVLDLDLPASSGLRLLEMLREQPTTRSVAVVALATFSYHEAAAAISAGADDCLIKPLPPDEVVAAARDLLERVDRWNATVRQVSKRAPRSA